MSDDEFWMSLAISLAENASRHGEVPVGALVVCKNRLIGTGFNLREQRKQASAHAEMLALEQASHWLKSWRLSECTLYVTLEPCLMCGGAIYQSRLDRVVFATEDPKGGALGSLYRLHEDQRLNHRYKVESGIMREDASLLLTRFFQQRRLAKHTRS